MIEHSDPQLIAACEKVCLLKSVARCTRIVQAEKGMLVDTSALGDLTAATAQKEKQPKESKDDKKQKKQRKDKRDKAEKVMKLSFQTSFAASLTLAKQPHWWLLEDNLQWYALLNLADKRHED